MDVKLDGFDELMGKLEKLKGIKTNTAMLAGAMKLQGYAQENAPYKTGYLRSSAESHETENGAELEFGAEYSLYQEKGTSKMPGKFYVTRAIDEHSDDIVTAVGNQIEKELGGA